MSSIAPTPRIAVCLLALVATTGAAAADTGAALLQSVVDSYRSVEGLTESMSIEIRAGGMQQTQRHIATFGANGDVSVETPDLNITASHGYVYLVRPASSQKYLQFDAGSDPAGAFAKTTKIPLLPVHLALRWADAEAVVKGMSFGQLTGTKFAGVTNKRVKGARLKSIAVEADNGSMTLDVNAVTRRLVGGSVTFTPPRAPEGTVVDLTIGVEAAPNAAASEALSFDAGDRFAVSTMQQLMISSAGEPAPDFELSTLDGATVRLADLRGSVVVLDFWATWCGPCRQGLPAIDGFHRWALDSGQPIRVYAVNVWERVPSADARREMVGDFWGRSGFALPTLMDLDDSVVGRYGFQSIPTTVVIGPDGVIANIHTGLVPNAVERLKVETMGLLPAGK